MTQFSLHVKSVLRLHQIIFDELLSEGRDKPLESEDSMDVFIVLSCVHEALLDKTTLLII